MTTLERRHSNTTIAKRLAKLRKKQKAHIIPEQKTMLKPLALRLSRCDSHKSPTRRGTRTIQAIRVMMTLASERKILGWNRVALWTVRRQWRAYTKITGAMDKPSVEHDVSFLGRNRVISLDFLGEFSQCFDHEVFGWFVRIRSGERERDYIPFSERSSFSVSHPWYSA